MLSSSASQRANGARLSEMGNGLTPELNAFASTSLTMTWTCASRNLPPGGGAHRRNPSRLADSVPFVLFCVLRLLASTTRRGNDVWSESKAEGRCWRRTTCERANSISFVLVPRGTHDDASCDTSLRMRRCTICKMTARTTKSPLRPTRLKKPKKSTWSCSHPCSLPSSSYPCSPWLPPASSALRLVSAPPLLDPYRTTRPPLRPIQHASLS